MMTSTSQQNAALKAKILVVSDEPIILLGLEQLISEQLDMTLCGATANIAEVACQTQALQPAIVLIGLPVKMQDRSTLFSQIKAAHPPAKILVATRFEVSGRISYLARAGADGCVCWQDPLSGIVAAIRSLLNGAEFFIAPVLRKNRFLAVHGKTPAGKNAFALSDREMHILAMIGQGMSSQQIAQLLDLSPRTIQSHRNKIKLKLGVRDSTMLNHHAFLWWLDHS